ncbi:hypothetical protein, partial [Methanosarcina mazei]|uniref:hypothetical protein n=1 Tax=Methanosarcina mazei TaxID=2209 RepID=UPI00138DF91F
AINTTDYKTLVEVLQEDNDFQTPVSLIKLTHNGNTYTTKKIRDTVEEIDALDYIKPDHGNEFKVGDTITLSSISEEGTGGKITAYDWQIGKDYTWNGPSDYDYKSSKTINDYVLDRPGTWVIFLNVRDSHKISGTDFENWSDWGNWRTEEPPPFEYTGVDIKGWYFTAIKFEVQE